MIFCEHLYGLHGGWELHPLFRDFELLELFAAWMVFISQGLHKDGSEVKFSENKRENKRSEVIMQVCLVRCVCDV
jgi:hypothetical protein